MARKRIIGAWMSGLAFLHIAAGQQPAATESATGAHAAPAARIDAWAESLSRAEDVGELLGVVVDKHGIPGMVGAVVDLRGVRAIGAAGVRVRGGEEKITIHDQMHLGSCTKAMTATLCAVLVEKGTLSWETTVGEVIKDLPPDTLPVWKGVTLAQLLTNTAGAPADLDAGGLWGRLWTFDGAARDARRVMLDGLVVREPAAPPGTKNIYSNAGFALAGHMAEIAADVPFEELMQREVFAPLGITSAGWGPPGSADTVDQPRGHTRRGKPVPPGRNADNPPAMSPAGRAHMSISDWGRFVALHLHDKAEVAAEDAPDDGAKLLLKPGTLSLLRTPPATPKTDYAFGWGTAKRAWGGNVVTHAGSNTMWYCVVWAAPEKGFAVLVACNSGEEAAPKACDEAAGVLIRNHLKP